MSGASDPRSELLNRMEAFDQEVAPLLEGRTT